MNEAEKFKFRADIADRDHKVKELNDVVKQLQKKLEEKVSEVNREVKDKDKFKGLYEQY